MPSRCFTARSLRCRPWSPARASRPAPCTGSPACCSSCCVRNARAAPSRSLATAGEAPLVVSGDLDLLQCARGAARVHIVARGAGAGRTYDEAAVWSRFGVAPAELPDWKALAGDVTDEIPGVPGVG